MSTTTTPETWQVFPLELLAPGAVAQVEAIYGDAEQVHRLEELGLRAGVTVEMVQSGSPCIIRLAGSKLCFRESELLNVLVRWGGSP